MKLIYLVGLPGSGKSEFAKGLMKKENAVILSSDHIREELFGDSENQKQTHLVYRTLYQRANEQLKKGTSVILDATHLEREKRIFSLQKFNQLNLPSLEKICYYFDTPYEICLERNETRKRTVPPYIMEKMRKKLELPFIGEGFDHVQIIHTKSSYGLTKEAFVDVVKKEMEYGELFEALKILPLFKDMFKFNQESHYHQFLLCEHTYYVYQYTNEYYALDDEKLLLQVAALFHDTGKPFCKTYKKLKDSYSYFAHENVSTQIACHFLYELGFDETFITKALAIIQFHMLINYGGDKGANEIYHLAGPELLTKLYFFKEADKFAK